MCYAKPGPRCSTHARVALQKASAAYIGAQKEHVDVATLAKLERRFEQAKQDYRLTPAGIKSLREYEKTHPEARGQADKVARRRAEMIAQYKANKASNTPPEDFHIVDDKGATRYLDASGQPHRADGPAVVHKDGSEEWYNHGVRHRGGGLPALTSKKTGLVAYYENGLAHREGGPARATPGGREEWMIRGEFHREGGPAVTSGRTGSEAYFRNGKLHNDKGPARIDASGRKEYWINGEQVDSLKNPVRI